MVHARMYIHARPIYAISVKHMWLCWTVYCVLWYCGTVVLCLVVLYDCMSVHGIAEDSGTSEQQIVQYVA